MRDPEPVGHGAGIADVIARAARALAACGGAIIIKLERDADHFRAARMGQRSDHRGIDPAAHRDDDPAIGSGARQIEQRGGIACGHQAGVKKGGGVHGRAAI